MSTHPHARRILAFVLMIASGFAGLGYQIVWTQQSALWLGHESAAVLAVVAAFFGGLALGSFVLGGHIDRSTKPGRWYATCELVIGLWGIALAFVLPRVTSSLLDIIGAQPSSLWHWSIAFCGTFLLLLPATAAMGATLPAMNRVLATIQRHGSAIAPLYAANTFGAVLGVLGAAFVLIPAIGLTLTTYVCVALNVLCAVLSLLLARIGVDEERIKPSVLNSDATSDTLPLLAATGLLGIGYEVLVVRALSQVAENTVYTFAILLAVYLVGTTIGATSYARWSVSQGDRQQRRDSLLRMLAATCAVGTLTLSTADAIKTSLQNAFGTSMTSALCAEATLAFVVFLLPTVVMGALFSHLATRARDVGIGFGHALGVNTLGASLAPLLFGVVLMPLLGVRVALLVVAAGYLALTSRRSWTKPVQWAPAVAILALMIWMPTLAIVDIPEGGRLVSYEEGAMATVSVIEDANGITTLHINNRQQEGSSATQLADARQALLPILLHASPHRALFLGLGTGVTVAAATEDSQLQVDVVELLPEVIAAADYFKQRSTDHSRLHVMSADARRFVRTSHAQYDVIVADNFHPARSGSGSLYTVEHFATVRARLADGGLFCQWLPLHQLDLKTLRSIVKSFLAVYPHGAALLATNSLDTPVVGLIGRSANMHFDIGQIRERLASAAMTHNPALFGFGDDIALLGNFIAGPDALARFARDAPLNTDDRPVVAYLAPQITYAPDSLPRDRLIALLHEVDVEPEELLAASADDAFDSRLAAYWTARNRFIEAGRNVRPSSDVGRMLAQVREPLLSVLQISGEFRPAYDPLLQMATALGHVDVNAARALLTELQHVQPARTEAAQALRDLSSDAL